MIARIWRGRVPLDRTDDYVRFLRDRAIPDYAGVPGNLGAWVLRGAQVSHGEVEVITLSFWESFQCIEAFAGSDISIAKYYEEDASYLLDFPKHVEHYTLFSR